MKVNFYVTTLLPGYVTEIWSSNTLFLVLHFLDQEGGEIVCERPMAEAAEVEVEVLSMSKKIGLASSEPEPKGNKTKPKGRKKTLSKGKEPKPWQRKVCMSRSEHLQQLSLSSTMAATRFQSDMHASSNYCPWKPLKTFATHQNHTYSHILYIIQLVLSALQVLASWILQSSYTQPPPKKDLTIGDIIGG